MTTNTPINLDVPPPPIPPEDDECCQSGCEDMCIFELYRLQKRAYDKKWGNKKSVNEV